MKYVCQICGYVYDEDKEGVPFESLPDTWCCPLCKAPKSQFSPDKSEVQESGVSDTAESNAPVFQEEEEDLKELSVGQLSALCSNLARACEKQYKTTESELFTELADYFSKVAPPVSDASIENIADMLKSEIDGYASVRAVSDENADRGSARACVWGDKVTRMLSSLVGRYLSEGEQMMAYQTIWVCTVCGFVYIGDSAPEACPVCKVPAWKFEKIERRVTA